MATAQNVEVAGVDVCVPAIVRGNACERREGVHTLLVCSQRGWEEEREGEKEEEGGRGLVGGVRMRVHHVAMLVSSSWGKCVVLSTDMMGAMGSKLSFVCGRGLASLGCSRYTIQREAKEV